LKFYGDFDKLKLIASEIEQLKVLLKENNWGDIVLASVLILTNTSL